MANESIRGQITTLKVSQSCRFERPVALCQSWFSHGGNLNLNDSFGKTNFRVSISQRISTTVSFETVTLHSLNVLQGTFSNLFCLARQSDMEKTEVVC